MTSAPGHPTGDLPRTGELLIVTPHPSGQLPADVLRDMLGDDAFDTPRREAFLRRIFLDGDPYTDLLFSVPGARHAQAPWSRFAADLNRERGDLDDNGVLKVMGFDRAPLYPAGWTPGDATRERRLRRIWDPFDALVTAELQGVGLMIVGHSMAPTGPALGADTGVPRPAICLMPGTPGQPTFPHALWDALQRACQDAFAPIIAGSSDPRVTLGEPWATDTLSLTHSVRSGVPAFGIEFNAGLYLQGGQPIDPTIRALNAAFGVFAHAALNLLRR
ncbi:N-formylglutamate amidohydrolase [Deinococcus aquaticus]|uniref:N-formylglutamate amidohydrolase n=1 Tax=Deinococcus aquaticus TaxID=328692 RepID=A0ABY7V1W4_9DEIO|nr:N-formylglutamate amidohydrolase [Deinococcus aquaticus]WDA57956.1 N-formylglutamate amidohydrolase [Deinococcus aquaticus]